MSLTAGTRLGPYEITSPIGSGGMGEVYKARDTRLDRTVAIKVLMTGADDDLVRRRRLGQEARAVSALNHLHFCTLHDVGPERRHSTRRTCDAAEAFRTARG
jgi:eukaryotic-like serine/threonine-protein kinase